MPETPNLHDLFQTGQLDQAVEICIQQVKQQPTDTDLRGLLCELYCFTGQWEKADQQIQVIGQQVPESEVGLSLLRQLIRAENARQQFFTDGRVPEFVGEVTPPMRLHLEASIAMRDGNLQEATEKLNNAESQRVRCQGTCDDQAFNDLRDLDDRTACFFEVLTSTGKYFWIPLEQVVSLEFRAPQRPRDLIWRAAHMTVHDGPDGEVYLPALYAGSCQHSDALLRMGRSTSWESAEGQFVQGRGQRIFLVGTQDVSIMQMTSLVFETPQSSLEA